MTSMIDLAEWEEDLAKLQVTRAPHRMGGRVIWIASRPAELASAEPSTLHLVA